MVLELIKNLDRYAPLLVRFQPTRVNANRVTNQDCQDKVFSLKVSCSFSFQ